MSTSATHHVRAFVLGSTGLVGREIVRGLTQQEAISSVTAFVRRANALTQIGIPRHSKLNERLINFDDLSRPPVNWFDSILPEEHVVLFSALGTTIKQAGSKDQQRLVDYTYQLEVAKEFSRVATGKEAVSKLVLISAAGANSNSPLFYPRIKGQLEEAVRNLKLSRVEILRPSLLIGKRETVRLGESMAEQAFHFIQKLGVSLPKSMTPIHATDVAKQAIEAALEGINK